MYRNTKTAFDQAVFSRISQLLLTVFILGIAFQIMGCGQQEHVGLSPNVEFLWRQHPNPYPEAAARLAAAEAKSLLEDNDDDIELHLYYIDRLRAIESDSLTREYQSRLERDPDNGVNIILEAYVDHSGPHLVEVIPRALELDSTTAEVAAFGSIAMMGSFPPDSIAALQLAFRALELNPGSYEAHVAMAQWQKKYGKPETALKYARSAGELNPWRWEPVSLQFVLLGGMGKEQDAVSLVEEFFASQPTNISAYRQLNRYYTKAEMWKKLFDMEMIIDAAYPEQGYAFNNAAEAAKKLEDYDLIFDAWEKATEYGFFDMEFLMDSLSEEELVQFNAHPRYEELIEMMEKAHEEANPQRKADALDNPLHVKIGRFTARDLESHPVSLSRYAGQTIILDFWSASERNHPLTVNRLKVFREKYPDIEVISVNVKERYPENILFERVGSIAEEQGIDWPVWIASDSLASRMRVKMVPVFAVIDQEGFARYRFNGYHPYVDEILGWMVDEIGGTKPREVARMD